MPDWIAGLLDCWIAGLLDCPARLDLDCQIANSMGTISAYNSAFQCNVASRGGALYIGGGNESLLHNVTVSKNVAALKGGGLFVDWSNNTTNVKITLCVFQNNQVTATVYKVILLRCTRFWMRAMMTFLRNIAHVFYSPTYPSPGAIYLSTDRIGF